MFYKICFVIFQDDFGQYNYGYTDHNSAKQEIKTADGTVQGTYSYVDSNGLLQTVNYIADDHGFRVAATNLPHAPAVAPVSPPVAAVTPVVAEPVIPEVKAAETILDIRKVGSQEPLEQTVPAYVASPYLYASGAPVAYGTPVAYSAPVPYETPVAHNTPVVSAAPVAPVAPLTPIQSSQFHSQVHAYIFTIVRSIS